MDLIDYNQLQLISAAINYGNILFIKLVILDGYPLRGNHQCV